MKKVILGLLPVLVLLTACGPGDSIEQATEQSVQQFEAAGIQNMENDALFAAEAASANMLHVQISQAALSSGVSPEVQSFAQRAEGAYKQMNSELQEVANQVNIVLPQTMGAAHQKVYDQVTGKEGISFDIEFIRAMLDQHKNLLKRYEDIAENGTSMEVKQYASRQLPLLRQHTNAAQRLQEKID
ncbi:DUF4142 domain-containing protein [uncultured Pontibacter sp.]|uniref:DUF4142 domain-containing protein n=1 Tax=uncultured Pontibacter sp. TaxID=453356 RepID=UPI002614CCE8|nr:DUF4142 domain-containing protein [uncultured Pontibacter sp.]